MVFTLYSANFHYALQLALEMDMPKYILAIMQAYPYMLLMFVVFLKLHN